MLGSFLVLSACFLSFPGFSQDQVRKEGTDPLQGKQKVDTAQVQSLLNKSDSLRYKNPDSAVALARRAIELSESINYELGKAQGFKNIGLIDNDKGDHETALRNYSLSLSIYEKEEDTLGISNLQNNIGSVHQTMGNNPKALEFFFKSLKNAEVVNNPKRIGTAYVNIGTVYSNDENTYDQAIENYEESIGYLEEAEYLFGVIVANLNLGDLYLKKALAEVNQTQRQEMAQKALPYLVEALQGFEEVGADPATPLNLLGLANLTLEEYDSALEFYQRALNSASEKETKPEESKANIGIGRIYVELGNPARAIPFLNRGIEIANETGILYDKQEAFLSLSKAYSLQNNFRSAFGAQQRYAEVQDSLRDKQYEDSMSELRTVFDLERKEREIELLNAENELNELQIEQARRNEQLYLIIMGLFLAIIAGFVFQYFYIRRTNRRLAFERNRSDQILLNILPKETADELKENGFVKAQEFNEITVLFTDFKAFSLIAERISAERLVKSVDYYFKNFDEITERNNLEKIKTIGDAYMCAGGLPSPNKTHVRDAYNAAFEILHFVKETEMNPPKDIYPFQIRIGLNSGPVVAGVVGTRKFAYDIWGNTVNIAARMESGSETGRINVSENIYHELKGEHRFTYRGELKVKNQVFKMYFAEEDEEAA